MVPKTQVYLMDEKKEKEEKEDTVISMKNTQKIMGMSIYVFR